MLTIQVQIDGDEDADIINLKLDYKIGQLVAYLNGAMFCQNAYIRLGEQLNSVSKFYGEDIDGGFKEGYFGDISFGTWICL